MLPPLSLDALAVEGMVVGQGVDYLTTLSDLQKLNIKYGLYGTL